MTGGPEFLASPDPDQFTAPSGWDFTIRSFDPKAFWYSKAVLPLGLDFQITRYDFRGRVRFHAGLKSPGLQINFIDSYSQANSRLQGMGRIETVVMITLPGYDWDGLSDMGALGIELNFGPLLADRILSMPLSDSLKRKRHVFGQARSIVAPLTPASRRLKHYAEARLEEWNNEATLWGGQHKSFGRREFTPRADALSLEDPLHVSVMLESARIILEEIAGLDGPHQPSWNSQRREIALQVERLLRDEPLSNHDDLSLDEIASRFGKSRRTLQLALQEQFGIGFKSLQRINRLYHIRKAIRSGETDNVAAVGAQFYRSQFGRLARDYKDFFGIKPSEELRMFRNKFQL